MRTAIDTNVISALWSREPVSAGLADVLHRAGQEGALVICGPVYAELLAYPNATRQFADGFLADTRIDVDTIDSRDVWARAGEAFGAYARRRRSSGGGEPKRLLVDFIVGAHAVARAERLLTLDPDRYRTAFPELELQI